MMLLIVLQILWAYIVADAFSGVYHMLTDLGWNIKSQVAFFQKHHDYPETMTFDLQPMVGALPPAIVACYFAPWFFGPLAFFVGFAQIPHYYVHHAERVPFFIRWLQKAGVIMSQSSHDTHHTSPHDRDYCIISGWNNFWLNRVAQVIHSLRGTA